MKKKQAKTKTEAPVLTSAEVRKLGTPIVRKTGSKAQSRIMDILMSNGKPLTAKQIVIATDFEMSEQYVNNTIYKLEAKGLVRRFEVVAANCKTYVYNELVE